ncbi:hypothetical protein TNCV_4630762 [Trichonephila clavipes]|nr:hypothetical protein TNCV_4630762 [Trichonephila clavipes]
MFGAITGNLGNNRADQLVQEATCRDMNLLMSVPLSHWKRLAWERAVSSWNTEFLASPKALWNGLLGEGLPSRNSFFADKELSACIAPKLRELRRWGACADVSIKWSVSRETSRVQLPSKLGTHLPTHWRVESSPARDLNPGPVT